MRTTLVSSGAPYVLAVSTADAADVTASGDGSAPYTLVLDAAFPNIQYLYPSPTNALTAGGTQPGVAAYDLTGPAVPVVFLSSLGVKGATGAGEASVILALNDDGTPVLDDTTHTPTVTVGGGALLAGEILWVALVPSSF